MSLRRFQATGGQVTKVGNDDAWMQAWSPVGALGTIAPGPM